MIFTKKYLNDQVQTNMILEHSTFATRVERDSYDVFISYSWSDRAYADKIVQLLEKCGYTVYIDYNDYRLDRNNVSKETARCLINQMKKCKGLLHLYSPNASVSKWCPWEVGVFSGINNFKCANLPLLDNSTDDFKKQEYLEIYPYIDYETVLNTSSYDFWVNESTNKYVKLREWLNGKEPYIHN